ncbi:MAG: RIP metalloprotease RseP, partial [Balneolaceae bacterium]|nr:RIP metalloprotease RseP [Balneolaceae bacterium]
MEWIVEIMSTLGIFAAALLILVFFHELGHFLAAKFFGMRVERFSLGFPPRIWGFKKGETDYCIGATPLGGYVKISGMIDESMDTDYLDKEPEPWEFRSKPVWQRLIVITAGVIFNMILAVVIFAGIALTIGEQKVPTESVSGIYVPDSTVVHEVGFRTGDKIVAVNGERVPYFSDLFSPAQLTASELSYTVVRNGEELTLSMPDSLLDQVGKGGFIDQNNIMFPSLLGKIQGGSPAEAAGLQSGDKIVAVNGDQISSWQELVEKIQNANGPLELTVLRGDERFQTEVTPNQENIIGIQLAQTSNLLEVKHIQYGLFGSIGFGIEKTEETFTGIIQGFAKMFSGDISVKENLGGPVAIAQFTKDATDRAGWLGFWN